MNFDHPEFLWMTVPEAYFSIFKVEKINQKLLEFITQRVFLTKPTTLNPMSISVFFGRFSWKILNFNYESYQCAYWFIWILSTKIKYFWLNFISANATHAQSEVSKILNIDSFYKLQEIRYLFPNFTVKKFEFLLIHFSVEG